MSRVRQAEVRFYIDADILGLARILAGLRVDTTYPGDPGARIRKRERPPCPIAPDEHDDKWLPIVASRGWLIVTRDSAIQRHRREINAVRENGARMVVLSGKDAVATFEQLEIVMCQWRRIEALVDQPGPFIYTATRTSLEPVDLNSQPEAGEPSIDNS